MNRTVPRLLLALMWIALFTSACEETVDVILESDRQFTLWGTLDMNRDTQFVRVVPIREMMLADPQTSLQVTVTSTNLTNGQHLIWRDTTVQFSNGSIGHLFYAPFRTSPSHTYRIEVSSPDLPLVTRAQTTMPDLPQVTILGEKVDTVIGPSGPELRAVQHLQWSRLRRAPYHIEQWYRFITFNDQRFVDVLLPSEPRRFPGDESTGTWEVQVDLVAHRNQLRDTLNLDMHVLAGLGQTITVLDPMFEPPGGAFDPDVLAQPGTFSNVENGFGFIGSVGRFQVEWTLTDEVMKLLGYRRNPPPFVPDPPPPDTFFSATPRVTLGAPSLSTMPTSLRRMVAGPPTSLWSPQR